IAEVVTAVAEGNLTGKLTVDAKGEIAALADTINGMIGTLATFADQVTNVAREVGIEGKLGGQAQVRGVAGTWKDLTDNVNMMANNLTGQVRGIASVVTAVAEGDLKRKLSVDAKGEIAALADTINEMIDTLATFADQVTNVAREVGVEGKLGGQARVPGAAGLWRDLTDNVNQLAANLTTQVRAIADVATAVTKGDLTRSITVEASGEVASLKDNINEMIRNLRDTTLKNAEQDWLKTNLARFTRMLQGERDLVTVSNLILSEIAPLVNAQRGVFYVVDNDEGEPVLDLVASYAFTERKNISNRFRMRQGLVGQCAFEKKRILLTHVPGDYISIGSALGEAPPLNIIVLPVLFEQEVKAVIELASFSRFSETHQAFLDQLTESIGIVLNTIAANMRTEGLLKQSQLLTGELQSQQEELKKTNERLEQQAATLRQSEELLRQQQDKLQTTNEELEEKARLLELQKREVETKNREVSLAKTALEEKAEQLSLTSRYKSQFLANMSHELRTPLNSLLILSKLLIDNPDNNLNEQQIEFARTIHSAGTDLLTLISDILDLSKVEAGKMEIHPTQLDLREVLEGLERSFHPVAEEKGITLSVEVAEGAPSDVVSDDQRVAQILRNLLSNAMKFTETGEVRLSVAGTEEIDHMGRPYTLAFSVSDTGIGIPHDKLRLIFEAFQQADGTTSRRYGGTGLGLSISREIARLLGGEIRVTSTEGAGSTFTLLLPAVLPPAPVYREEDESTLAVAEIARAVAAPPASQLMPEPSSVIPPDVPDDRDEVVQGDRIVLIVESDVDRSTDALSTARSAGFKGLIALRPETAIALAQEHGPDVIALGIREGEEPATLDRLKHDPSTRHIPVVVLCDEERRHDMMVRGAAVVAAPDDDLAAAMASASELGGRRTRMVLVVDDDQTERRSVAALIGGDDVQVDGADSS
ncbi:MAG: ATP-binding protein, partial [Microvirga sp.]